MPATLTAERQQARSPGAASRPGCVTSATSRPFASAPSRADGRRHGRETRSSARARRHALARGRRRQPGGVRRSRAACAGRCRARAGRRRADRSAERRDRPRGRGSSRPARPSGAGRTRRSRRSGTSAASSAARATARFRARSGPVCRSVSYSAAGAISPSSWPAVLEPQNRAIAQDDAGVVRDRPGRPPVNDRGAQAGARRDFPERRDQPLVARGDRRAREPQRGRSRPRSPPRIPTRRAAGRRRRRPAAIRARECRAAPAADPVAIVVQTRAGSRSASAGSVATPWPKQSIERAGNRPAARSRSSVATSTPSTAMTTTRRPVGTTVSGRRRTRRDRGARRDEQRARASERDRAERNHERFGDDSGSPGAASRPGPRGPAARAP